MSDYVPMHPAQKQSWPPAQPYPAPPGPLPYGQVVPQPPRKRHRVFPWFFLAVQILFLVWIIVGLATVTHNPDCGGTLDKDTCQSATDAGATVGAGLIIALWAAVDIILGISYLIIRLARRP